MKIEKLSLAELTAKYPALTGTISALSDAITVESKKAAFPKKDPEDPDDDEDGAEDDDNDGDGTKPKTKKAVKKDPKKDPESEFKDVNALVPEGEHFAVEAINEGLWITEGHLRNIQTSLADNTAKVTKLSKDLSTAQSSLLSSRKQVKAATDENTELKAENETLKSEDGTETTTPTKVKTADIESSETVDLATAQTKWDVEIQSNIRKYKLNSQKK